MPFFPPLVSEHFMLPEVQWTELIPSSLAVAVRERDTGVDGNVSALELEIISKLVRLTDPGVLFEIGTFDGRTTLNLAAHSRASARVYTLDLPRAGMDGVGLPLAVHDRKYVDKAESGIRFHGTDVEHKIVQLYGDSATFDYRPYLGKVDFLFIDGSHSYHYVLNDSWAALRLVRGQGVILWHDYVSTGHCCWPGLVRALDELHANEPPFRGLQHIAGTALAILRVSSPRYLQWVKSLAPRLFGTRPKTPHVRDSRQPRDLGGNLRVEFRETRVPEGTPFLARVSAENSGRAVWLPTSAGEGAVHVGCHLLDPAGRILNADYCRCLLTPGTGTAVLPGDNLTADAQIPSPTKGRYIIEFDLVAEGVCWFARTGAKAVRVPIEVL
jgi:predicted O-methyltransferase YrrM